MQFAFGGLSIFLSVAITTFGAEMALVPVEYGFQKSITWLKVVTFVNTICIAVVASFRMGERASAARQASRDLEAAIYRYRWEPAFTIKELNEAFSKAQATMGHPAFEPFSQKKS